METEDMKKSNEEFYKGKESMGEMHVYKNKPMKFIPAKVAAA